MNFSPLPVPNSKAMLLLSRCVENYEHLEEYRKAGAQLLITLLPLEELARLGVPLIGEEWGGDWLHLPIEDFGVPDSDFEKKWNVAKQDIHTRIEKGEAIALHCRAGLGRTGTIAAKILIERGMDALDAVQYVRRFRDGAIEVKSQEDYLQRGIIVG